MLFSLDSTSFVPVSFPNLSDCSCNSHRVPSLFSDCGTPLAPAPPSPLCSFVLYVRTSKSTFFVVVLLHSHIAFSLWLQEMLRRIEATAQLFTQMLAFLEGTNKGNGAQVPRQPTKVPGDW